MERNDPADSHNRTSERLSRIKAKASVPSTEHMNRLDIEAFVSIADMWGLDSKQRCAVLGIVDMTFEDWTRQNPRLTYDQRVRVEYVCEVGLTLAELVEKRFQYQALNCRYEELDWKSPLELMQSRDLRDFERVLAHGRMVAGY